jgi:hypothetical protein
MKQVVLVSTLVLVMAVLVATPVCAQVAASAQDKALPGSWLVKVWGPGFEFLSLVTINADGTWQWILPTTALDGTPNADSRVVCTGPWHRTGARTFHLTMYCLASQALDTSSGRYMFDVTLSKDGTYFEDPAFRWEWFINRLPDDSGPDGGGYLTVEGTRIPDLPKP